MSPGRALLSRHVFLDLETTGLDPRTDAIIELGALFVEDGREVRRLSRLFSAGRPLPLAIRRLTGLTDRDLAGQPPFASALPELREALAGWTVVAHNAPFEKGFLPGLLGPNGSDVPPVLDSCELLHYLHPELPSHSLDALVRWAGRGERGAHRALEDCEATLAVVAHALDGYVTGCRADEVADLLEALDDAPGAALRLAQAEAGELGAPAPASGDPEAAPLVTLLRALLAACRARVAPLVLEPVGFRPARPERLKAGGPTPAAEDEAPYAPVTTQDVDRVLGPGGALEALGDGFRPRAHQLGLAHEVARALSDGGVLALEAGTGTGKSLAYLTPAALWAARNGRKVGVAPHTKTLQDQLIEKDLPRLHRATQGAFGYALLKGQTNYVCRRRALEATRVEPGMPHAARAPRAYLRAFLRRSPDGDLDRLSHWFRERFPQTFGLVPAVRSEAATTLGEKCPHFHRCAYHSAVDQARKADVLVVNQALAFAWPARYPKLEHLVLDEAHEVEDVATTALTSELSDHALERLAERLRGRDGRRGLFAELRRALFGSRRAEARTLASEAESAHVSLARQGKKLGERVLALCEDAGGEEAEDAYAPELRVTEATRALPLWKMVEEALRDVGSALEALHRALAVKVPEALPDLAARNPALERELAGACTELLELQQLCEQLAGAPQAGRCYQASAEPRRERWALSAQPVDVAGYVARDFAQNKRALVLASATLSVGERAGPYVLRRLGLAGTLPDAPRASLLKSPSPFALEKQALVVLVTDAPPANDEAFVGWAAGRITGLAQGMGGRVLGLFASARRMERVGRLVAEKLEPWGIEVLRQSRGHARSLAARQERDAGSVLLGTKSFWQGVDIPGLGVACVFIDKLPLEPANRPLVAAREEALAARSRLGAKAGFLQYRLPRALLMLRQGVGRLIRSPDDRGVVVVADPGHPGYRAQLLEALQGYRVEALPWAQARVKIHQELVAMGLLAAARGNTQDTGS